MFFVFSVKRLVWYSDLHAFRAQLAGLQRASAFATVDVHHLWHCSMGDSNARKGKLEDLEKRLGEFEGKQPIQDQRLDRVELRLKEPQVYSYHSIT